MTTTTTAFTTEFFAELVVLLTYEASLFGYLDAAYSGKLDKEKV